MAVHKARKQQSVRDKKAQDPDRPRLSLSSQQPEVKGNDRPIWDNADWPWAFNPYNAE